MHPMCERECDNPQAPAIVEAIVAAEPGNVEGDSSANVFDANFDMSSFGEAVSSRGGLRRAWD